MIKPSAIILASSALALLASPSLGQERNFDFDKITSVEVHSGLQVTIQYGETQSVSASAQSEADFDDLEITVKDGTLYASHSRDFWDSILTGAIIDAVFGKNKPIKLSLTITDINSILASSAATVDVSSFAGKQLSLSSSSGAMIAIEGSSFEDTILDASSGSVINAQGACAALTISASSGASISAQDLTCLTGDVQVSSGASASLFTSEAIFAYASSGASINISGTPAKQEFREGSGGAIQIVE